MAGAGLAATAILWRQPPSSVRVLAATGAAAAYLLVTTIAVVIAGLSNCWN